MKTLVLLRHAKSDWDGPRARDFDRPLNAKGRRAAATMGTALADLGMCVDAVLASPAVRVRQTLDALGATFGSLPAVRFEQRLYLASAETILDVVGEGGGAAGALMVVGHNPGLEQLVLDRVPLVAGPRSDVEEKFPTASVAMLRIEADDWVAAVTATMTLDRFLRPRDLDPSLGPDAP